MSTFEPDWTELGEILNPSLHDAICDAQAVIESYRRQQAAQGIVEIRREDVDWMIDYLLDHVGFYRDDENHKDSRHLIRLRDALAAAEDQDE